MNKLTPHGILALNKVAAWLDDGAKHIDIENGRVIDLFDMAYSVTERGCGTACCIAGAVVQFEGLPTVPMCTTSVSSAAFYGDEGVSVVVSNYLGLSNFSAMQLFTPWEVKHNGEWLAQSMFSSPSVASAAIKHLIKTGDVKWFAEVPE